MIVKIKKTPLCEEVYERIKENLFSGEYYEGSLIPSENELSKQLCVSRVVVRNALQRLREEKIIVTYQGKGSFFANPKNFLEETNISSLSFDEFNNIMEFRATIEQSAIKRAVKFASDFELLNIKKSVEAMKRNKDDLTAFTKADYDFHLEIHKCSKNKLFYESIENFKPEIIACLTAMNSVNDSRDFALSLHEKIADALIERDAKKALSLLNNNGEYNFARMKEFFN